MLHILNGDSTAEIFKRSQLKGEHLVWREAFIAGPAPQGLSPDEWRDVRAQYLAQNYEANLQKCKQELREQEEGLQSFRVHDEVVLWFEHDLFCQLHLIYLLDWFSRQQLGNTQLSLICIGEFPGKPNFRGLGELLPGELDSLFPMRHEVTADEFELAREAWAAYCSPDPRAIEAFLAHDSSALLFLAAGLRAHLARFPSVKNGLGIVENRALELIESGNHTFAGVFRDFMAAEPTIGFGDFQFWCDVKRLAVADVPFIEIAGVASLSNALSADSVHQAVFRLTDQGRAALAGTENFVKLNGIDYWLGGVHLTPSNLWQWDETGQQIVKN